MFDFSFNCKPISSFSSLWKDMKNMQMHNENYCICRIYGYQKFLISWYQKIAKYQKKTGYPDIKKKAGYPDTKKGRYPDTKKSRISGYQKRSISGYIKRPAILCNSRMDLALMDFQLKKPKWILVLVVLFMWYIVN